MKLLMNQDQHAMGLHEATDGPITFERSAARAVVYNNDGHVAVMHFTATGSYKLPGGGVDAGENFVEALKRELQEEMGYTVTNIQELGMVTENRYFCSMHQISYCYTAHAEEFVGTSLTKKEQAQGMNLRWARSTAEALEWIASGRTLDEDGSYAGLEMMKARDSAIIRAADAMR